MAGLTYHLLTDMIHYGHDGVLVPPLGVLDRLNLATHDDDLASWNQLSTAISRAKVLGNAGWRNVAVQRLR